MTQPGWYFSLDDQLFFIHLHIFVISIEKTFLERHFPFHNSRVSLAFFAICGLDVLDLLETLSEQRRQEVCDWLYRYQVTADPAAPVQCGGFQGSSTINILNVDISTCGSEQYKYGHLAMTYTGIAILLTLGDDLSRLNRRAIVDGVAAVQRSNGSFSATVEGNEYDMRFVFCASAICFMLNDWGSVNKALMADYIKQSIVSMSCSFSSIRLLIFERI